jgi:hypothetical protein
MGQTEDQSEDQNEGRHAAVADNEYEHGYRDGCEAALAVGPARFHVAMLTALAVVTLGIAATFLILACLKVHGVRGDEQFTLAIMAYLLGLTSLVLMYVVAKDFWEKRRSATIRLWDSMR